MCFRLRTVLDDAKRDLLDQRRVFEVVNLAVDNLKGINIVVLAAHLYAGCHWLFDQIYSSLQAAAIHTHGSKPLTQINYLGFDVVHTDEWASAMPKFTGR